EEINRFASQTSFNGLKVLDGTFGTQTFQVGANSGETIGISGLDSRGSQLGSVIAQTTDLFDQTTPVSSETGRIPINGSTLVVGEVTIGEKSYNINNTVSDVEGLASLINDNNTNSDLLIKGDNETGRITVINSSGADVPVNFNLADNATPPNKVYEDNLNALGGGLDKFFEAGNTGSFEFEVNGISFTANDVGSLQDVVGQVNAKANDTGVKANLDKSNTNIIFSAQHGEDFEVNMDADLNGDGTPDNFTLSTSATAKANTRSMNNLDISTPEGADEAMVTVDYAIDQINGYRAELGAVQNRFESTTATLSTT
ncbi:MAG: hypothetical protein HLX50_24685, partial [Alteromonadaceae bacterium]|nr:hypothetical protein [Alteromonadaceae bacterium]